MTADISSSVAEKAECWCDGRKNRRSLFMGCRLTPVMSFRTSVLCFTRRETNFFQSLPEPRAHVGPYRSNRSCTVPLLILPVKVSLQAPQSSAQVIVLGDGPVIAQSGRARRCGSKPVDAHLAAQEIGELALRGRFRAPLHKIGSRARGKALRQFTRGAVGQGPVAGDKVISPAFFRGERANKWEAPAQGEGHGRYIFLVAPRQPLLQNASGTKALPQNRIEILRIKQAGTGGFQGRWRIDRDHVVLLRVALQVAAAIV